MQPPQHPLLNLLLVGVSMKANITEEDRKVKEQNISVFQNRGELYFSFATFLKLSARNIKYIIYTISNSISIIEYTLQIEFGILRLGVELTKAMNYPPTSRAKGRRGKPMANPRGPPIFHPQFASGVGGWEKECSEKEFNNGWIIKWWLEYGYKKGKKE